MTTPAFSKIAGSEHPDTKIDINNPTLHQLRVHPSHGQLQGTIEKWELTKIADPYTYQFGFGNEFCTEAVPNALPARGNTPMKCNHGLYAEQLSGTTFTTPRVANKRTWMYKIKPSASHTPYKPYKGNTLITNDFSANSTDIDADIQINPNQLRWKAFPLIDQSVKRIDFVDGLITLGGSGSPEMKAGWAVHIYSCNSNMSDTKRVFNNSDGDLLIVPQLTPLLIKTTCGRLRVAPGEFSIIPRGIKFAVDLDYEHDYSRTPDEIHAARGYICEVYDGHFSIPDLGPIGADGLANPRHFVAPTAYYENNTEKHELIQKFIGKLFTVDLASSPFDVVGWQGNYYPVKYDLAAFNTVNSVSFDHLDPSIFTVVTCQTHAPGVAACDFVVFPPRYAVQDDTFRPPYYHVNIASEFMGLINGGYDAKVGFAPGTASLHSPLVAHGPDSDTYKKFSNKETAPSGPIRMSKNDLAFMFESNYMMKLTKWANNPDNQQTEYYKCWQNFDAEFDPATSTPSTTPQ